MKKIDGSWGEGGGQILRTSLSLAMLQQTPIEFFNIRAGRKKPGLKRQHMAAVKAAAILTQAKVEGCELGSTELRFTPKQKAAPGDYNFCIGTAGSTGLVFQTILPALLQADGPCSICIEGGTHNPMAPNFDFLDQCYLPNLQRMGQQVTLRLEKRGFYPGGGGILIAQTQPSPKPKALDLSSRGSFVKGVGSCLIANLWDSIAEKEIQLVQRYFPSNYETQVIRDQKCDGVGNVLMLTLEHENALNLFTSYGERGRPSKKVVGQLKKESDAFLNSQACVNEYLADQLILIMALGEGGRFTTTEISDHLRTQMWLLPQFLDIDFKSSKVDDHTHLIEVIV